VTLGSFHFSGGACWLNFFHVVVKESGGFHWFRTRDSVLKRISQFRFFASQSLTEIIQCLPCSRRRINQEGFRDLTNTTSDYSRRSQAEFYGIFKASNANHIGGYEVKLF
jgi:hypothetical protein